MAKDFFRNQFMPHTRVYSNTGKPIKVKLIGHYDDDGEFTLIPNGKVNLYEEIQSHADSVDIHVIMKRYQNGDFEALNKIQGAYGDFTKMPTSYAEMLNFLIARKEEFIQLDPEVRLKFGNDFNRYMATAGSEEWVKNLGFVNEAEKVVEKLVEKESGANE